MKALLFSIAVFTLVAGFQELAKARDWTPADELAFCAATTAMAGDVDKKYLPYARSYVLEAGDMLGGLTFGKTLAIQHIDLIVELLSDKDDEDAIAEIIEEADICVRAMDTNSERSEWIGA